LPSKRNEISRDASEDASLFFIERKTVMRLDKYLKVSRLIKRRTVANEACDNERVSVNGRVVRASYEVKEGDVITIRFGERTLSVEVLTVQESVGKAGAAQMYREVNV